MNAPKLIERCVVCDNEFAAQSVRDVICPACLRIEAAQYAQSYGDVEPRKYAPHVIRERLSLRRDEVA